MVTETPGGGGWGDPTKRDPEAVLLDVLEGLVSIIILLSKIRRHFGLCIVTIIKTQRAMQLPYSRQIGNYPKCIKTHRTSPLSRSIIKHRYSGIDHCGKLKGHLITMMRHLKNIKLILKICLIGKKI